MQVSLETDLAIRVLFCIASFPTVSTAEELSAQLSAASDSISTVLQRLLARGWLVKNEAKQGSYLLHRKLETITLLDAITVLGEPLHMNRCDGEERYCKRFATTECPVRNLYRRVEEEITRSLEAITLVEFVNTSTPPFSKPDFRSREGAMHLRAGKAEAERVRDGTPCPIHTEPQTKS